MSPRHHPEESILLEYAAGGLREGGRLVVDGHLGACPSCRRMVAEIESLGGALLDGLPPTPMGADALALALARIERPVPAPGPAPKSPTDWIEVPDAVAIAAMTRRRWSAPGVWVAPVTGRPGRARSYLLRVGAGMSVPRHTHRGDEMVLVLKGAYEDGSSRHEAGDFACNGETIDHQPRITLDGECVCLVSAEHALVPLDWIGRIFQPVVGI